MLTSLTLPDPRGLALPCPALPDRADSRAPRLPRSPPSVSEVTAQSGNFAHRISIFSARAARQSWGGRLGRAPLDPTSGGEHSMKPSLSVLCLALAATAFPLNA